ncbi:MAG: SprT-like domain-containing protein [Pseudomonadota bacterium]
MPTVSPKFEILTEAEFDALSECTARETSTVQSNSKQTEPTIEVSVYWSTIYNIVNRIWYDGKLPPCMITLERRGRTMGYFRPRSFASRDGGRVVHQIALNPSYFSDLGDIEALQTFVHEIVHLWREELGPKKPPSRGYHCRVWGREMERIGLMPSHTGRPNGRKTGYQMMVYPIPGGAFEQFAKEIVNADLGANWRDARKVSHQAVATDDGTASDASPVANTLVKPKPTRTKWICPIPGCIESCYAKHTAHLKCGLHDVPLITKLECTS